MTFAVKSPLTKRIIRSCDSFSADIIDFDDSCFHSISDQHKIASIQFFRHKSWILGFHIKYKTLDNNEYLAGKSVISTSVPYEIEEFIIKDNDFIVKIQGIYSNSNRVETLVFETKKGETFCFDTKGKSNLKKIRKTFEIECKYNWKCVSLIGGFDYFEAKKMWGLVYIGMEMVPSSKLKLVEKESEENLKMAEFITQIPIAGNNNRSGVGNSLKRKKSLKF